MKTIMYLFFAIVGLICAICALIILSTQPTNGVQVIGLLSLAIFGLAMTMIFGYLVVTNYRENRAIDLAAKEQMKMDYETTYYGY
jgi:hypothetical protein